MTDTFTASNGVEIEKGTEGHLLMPPAAIGLGMDSQQALREFFQHERDEQLGRWRWPEDPRYIVKPVDEHVVCVVNEEEFWDRPHGRQGERGQLRFRDVRECKTDAPLSDTAARYKQAAWAFWQAHPELMPMPWHDAKPGELWGVTLKAGIRYDAPSGEELPMQVFLDQTGSCGDSLFFAHWNGPDSEAIDIECEHILSAVRLWPEPTTNPSTEGENK